MNPIDLLPIIRPLEDTNPPSELFFYTNVVAKVVPDVVEMMMTGIPINLENVSKLEDTVINVLDKSRETLENNKTMLEFLALQNNKARKSKIQELHSKEKSVEDFIKEYNAKNKVHKSFLVNTILYNINREDLMQDEWTLKDIKKVNSIIDNEYLYAIINNSFVNGMNELKKEAMEKLAKKKADLYNTNKIQTKIDKTKEEKLINQFNPASSKQKGEFFEFLGIEPENVTDKGAPKWDRASLETLLKQVEAFLENKKLM